MTICITLYKNKLPVQYIHLCVTNLNGRLCLGRKRNREAISYKGSDIYKWQVIIVTRDLSDRFLPFEQTR